MGMEAIFNQVRPLNGERGKERYIAL
jgi:hypothetical protein